MIKVIINGIISLVLALVQLILYPIDLLINQYMPGLSEAFNLVSNFFDLIGDIIPFVLSYTGLTVELISMIVDILVFIYTLPYLVHSIKQAIKWYNSLKL